MIEFVPEPVVIDHPLGTVQLYDVALGTAVTLYTCPDNAGHCETVPIITPGVAGVAGLTVTGKEAEALVPQLFPAVTLMFPFCPALPDVTVIEFVPAPVVISHPVGIDQV